MTSKISNKVLEKINEENIQPIARWRFVMQNSLIWLIVIVTVVCAGLSISLILGDLADGDWDLRPMMGISLLNYIWITFPFVWVLLGLILFFIAYYDFKIWSKSYKYSGIKYISYVLAIIIGLGLIVYYAGWHNPLRIFLYNQVPALKQIELRKQAIWNQPDQGRLSGTILERNGESIIIEDAQGTKWTISIENATKPPRVKLIAGEKIKLIGKIIEKNEFQAEAIKPWGNGKKSANE